MRRVLISMIVFLAAVMDTPADVRPGRAAELSAAARPGGRVLLDAHNCYPEHDQWTDRLERALATGLPVAIEQDLVWYRDPATGRSRSIVSHGEPYTGREPSLEAHFFERIRGEVERALREDRRERWPLIVLNLDLKTNEPEHLAALWQTLGKYESWLTTAERVADGSRVMPLDAGPLLVLTGNPAPQQIAFHDDLRVGERLRLFGAIPVDLTARVEGRQAADTLVDVSPEGLIASAAGNYRRWVNFPWAVVERGGQRQAGDWSAADRARLDALVARAHGQQLWIRFYTLNGHADTESRGWTASYNFGSLAAAQQRWTAARAAAVDFIASDQYEALAAVLK